MKRLASAIIYFCFTCFSGGTLLAQNASVSGTITDTSDAVVPQAIVVVINTKTGVQRKTISNQQGIYNVSELPPGSYRIRVDKPGFQPLVRENLTLDVAVNARVDLKLRVGNTKQTVIVESGTEALQTATTSLGNIRYGEQIQTMPLNSRGISSLYPLTAGVPVYSNGVNPPVSGFVDNQGVGDTAYVIDGTVANSPINGNSGDVPSLNGRVIEQDTPNLESVAEFSFNTADGKAEFSQISTISVVSKSGTNELHGSLFEYNRVGATSARSFFSPVRESLTRNQFGGSIGGPVDIPGLYNGHNRTFFFGAYEGFRDYRQFAVTGKFPNSEERVGDLNVLAATLQLRDPNGGVFPNNIIPRSRLSPVSQALLAYVPVPAGDQSAHAATAYNFAGDKPEVDWTNKFDVKLDHRFSDKDSISGRLTYSDNFNNWTNSSPLPNQIGLGTQTTNARQFSISETHIVNPANLNEFRAGFWRKYRLVTNGLSNTMFLTGDHTIPGINPQPPFAGLPSVEINSSLLGVTSSLFSASTTDRRAAEQTEQASDSYTLVHGRHTFKFGADIRRQLINNYSAANPAGDFMFSSSTSPANSATGDSFADFLLGLPQSDTWQTAATSYPRSWQDFFFAQDDYRVNSRLTLNAGLRWEYFGRFTEKYSRDANFILSLGEVAVPSGGRQYFLPQFVGNPLIATASSVGLNASLLHPDLNNFAPRFGLAYQPFDSGKTVIRAAYGVFYSPYSGFLNFQDATLAPYNLSYSYSRPSAIGAGGTPPSFANPFATGGASSNLLASVNSVDPNYRDLYSQVWNFTIEQQVGGGFVLRTSYVGNKGTRLPRQVYANGCLPGPIACQARSAAQNPAINPLFPVTAGGMQTNGNSIYHAWQTEIERRYSNGLFLNANYTFDRLIDDGGAPENPIANSSLDRGRDATSITSIFHLNAVWALPFGPKQRFFGNASGATAKVIGGWQLAGLLHLQSGIPFTVTAPAANSGTGSTVNRANRIADGRLPADRPLNQKLAEYFNTAAFQLPALGQVGNAGIGALVGPGLFDTDMTLMKNTVLTERLNLQFRAEFFNIFNHPNFANPVADITSSAFGQINSTVGFPRQIQFALRLQF